jgi:hypothetical protein
MNNVPLLMLALLTSEAPAPDSPDGDWQLGGRVLILRQAGAPLYKLDCTGSELVVTQFGVTQLLDIRRNKPVPDAGGTELPEGASYMALATDTSEPNLIASQAVRNPIKGWDMTIRLPKNDPAFLSLPRAKFISLFTTGYTQAVMLGKDGRKRFETFVSQCGAAN